MKYLVIERRYNWYGECTKRKSVCIVDTEEKAIAEVQKLSESKYTNDNSEFDFEALPNNSDEYLETEKTNYYENLKSDIENLETGIEERKVALEQLKRIRNLFKPFHLEQYTRENVKDIFPELHKIIVENDLPVRLFDGKYDYDNKGKTEWSGRERFTYTPFFVHTPSRCFYYFESNGYDIDDDIKRMRSDISFDKKELANLKKESEE